MVCIHVCTPENFLVEYALACQSCGSRGCISPRFACKFGTCSRWSVASAPESSCQPALFCPLLWGQCSPTYGSNGLSLYIYNIYSEWIYNYTFQYQRIPKVPGAGFGDWIPLIFVFPPAVSSHWLTSRSWALAHCEAGAGKLFLWHRWVIDVDSMAAMVDSETFAPWEMISK